MTDRCTCYDHLTELAITTRIIDGKMIHPGCGKEFVRRGSADFRDEIGDGGSLL